MNKHLLLRCMAAVTICSGGARAQVVQNFDFSLLWSTKGMPSQTVPNSDVKINYSRNFSCCSYEIGYQFARTPAGSLWFEFAYMQQGGSLNANIPSSGNRDLAAQTIGLRFAIPVAARLSFFGAAGGGDGEFHYPWIFGGSTPILLSHSTTHGVFQWGGGVDVRLSKRVSIRGEVRDLITGRGLSGSDGIHHLLTLVGVGFHF